MRPRQDARDPESGAPGNERMAQQPEFTSIPTSPATPPGAMSPAMPASPEQSSNGAGAHHAEHGPQRIPRWLERAELFLRVLLRLYVGLAVCIFPWWPAFWDENPLFLRFPTMGSLALHGAVRGIISGLGVLNLWVAFRDAMRKGRE